MKLQYIGLQSPHLHNTTTVLRPIVRDYRSELVPEETSPTHHPDHHPIFISFFHLLRSTASSLFKLRACLAIFWHNLSPCLLWSTSWSGALHLIFPIRVFFPQHMPIPSQPDCCNTKIISSVVTVSKCFLSVGFGRFCRKKPRFSVRFRFS